VRERKVSDGLTHHRNKRLGTLERERHETDAPASPQGQSRPRGEWREPLERGRRAARVLVNAKLEDCRRRLPEQQRVRAPRTERLWRAAPVLERAADRLGCRRDVGNALAEPVRGEERRRRLGLEAPKQGPRMRGLGRQPDHLLGRLALVGSRRERLPQELEGGLGQLQPPVPARLRRPLEADRRGEMRGRDAGERLLAEAEWNARPIELERCDDLALDRQGHDPHDRRAGSGGNSPHGRGRGGVAGSGCELGLAGVDLRSLDRRSLELGGEGSRLGVDRPGDEAAASLLDEAHDDDLRADAERDCPREGGERPLKRAVANQRERCLGERLQGILVAGEQGGRGRLGGFRNPPHGSIIARRRRRGARILACGKGAERQQSRPMATPAPRRADLDEPRVARPAEESPIDPHDYLRELRRARARRRSRIEHERELKRARVRFLVLLGGLLFLVAFIVLSIWEKIQALFGL
jgi:hypothetical protein